MAIADDNLPPEISSRVRAATAHASVRSVTHDDAPDPELPHGRWNVVALAGDRLVEMVLALRADGSVFEETRTFLVDQIVNVSQDADGVTIELRGPSGPNQCESLNRSGGCSPGRTKRVSNAPPRGSVR